MGRNEAMDDVSSDFAETADWPAPLYTLSNKLDNPAFEQDVLDWAKKARQVSIRAAKKRNQDLFTNQALFRGEVTKSKKQIPVSHLEDVPVPTAVSPETEYVVVNLIHDLVETRVSRFTRYRDNLDVIPANPGESSDRESARLVKELLGYLRYVTNFKTCLEDLGRRMMLGGEAYIFCEWNPDKGELIPGQANLPQDGSMPPPAQTDPNQLDAPPPSPDQPQLEETPIEEWRTGEVDFRVPYTHNIFLDPVIDGDYEKVNYILERELVHVEELKRRFPSKAAMIKEESFSMDDTKAIAAMYDQEQDGKMPRGYAWCWYAWHKSHPYLPQGRLLIWTGNVLLKNVPHPYDHKKLPCVRLIDVKCDGKLYPRSLVSLCRNLSGLLNNTYSLIYRYLVLLQPKWVYPRTADVQTVQLGNDVVGLSYNGQVAPDIKAPPAMSGELFAYSQELKEMLKQLMVVFPMAQGNVPPNIRAGVSMLFMDEQENERFDAEAKKHNSCVLEVWKLAFALVRQFYSKDEKRKLAIFGKDEDYVVKEFDPTILNGEFEIRLQNAPSLPESKAARTQYLLDIDERKPLPPDQFFQYLDLGIPEAYTNEVTKAKRAADCENEDFMSGKAVLPPQPWEDQVAHLLRLYLLVQSQEFKLLPPEKQTPVIKHGMLHEYYAFQQTFLDFDMTHPIHQGRAELLLQMPLFPSFMSPNTDRAVLAQQVQDAQMEAQGAMAGAMPMGAPMGAGGPPTGQFGAQGPNTAGQSPKPTPIPPPPNPVDMAQSHPESIPEPGKI